MPSPDSPIHVGLTKSPNWLIFSISLILLVVFLVLTFRPKPKKVSEQKTPSGQRILVGTSLQIDIVSAAIQDLQPSDDHSAIVLPTNTAFDDECIKDNTSSLGAFFQKHFPSGIDQIQVMIREEAAKVVNKTVDKFQEAPSGTTILLDKPLGSAHKILITAVTRYKPESGIKADTISLLTSVKNVCKLAARNRLSHLYIPVLGTGHGGLDFGVALTLLLVQSANCVLREGTHHIKRFTVVVYDPDGQKTVAVNRIVSILGQVLRGV